MKDWLWVFLGGGLGSVIRFYFSGVFNKENFFGMHLPIGTLLVNVASCFVLGMLIQRQASQTLTMPLNFFLLVGFCGGLSTFSAFGYELYHYVQKDQMLHGLGYLCISISTGIGAILLGVKILS